MGEATTSMTGPSRTPAWIWRRTDRDEEAMTTMAGSGAEESGSCGGALLSSWRRGDVGNGRRTGRQVGDGPDLAIPDDERAATVFMLRGRLEAPATGMVVFLGDDVGRAAGAWVGAEDLRRPWRLPCNREQEPREIEEDESKREKQRREEGDDGKRRQGRRGPGRWLHRRRRRSSGSRTR